MTAHKSHIHIYILATVNQAWFPFLPPSITNTQMPYAERTDWIFSGELLESEGIVLSSDTSIHDVLFIPLYILFTVYIDM